MQSGSFPDVQSLQQLNDMIYLSALVATILAVVFGPGLLNWAVKTVVIAARKPFARAEIAALFSAENEINAEVAVECWEEIAAVAGFPWSRMRPEDQLRHLCAGVLRDFFNTADCRQEIVSIVERRSGPIKPECFPRTVVAAVRMMAKKS
jgi:hypothetical protein